MDIYHLQGTIVQSQVKEGMPVRKHLFKVIIDNTRASSKDLVWLTFIGYLLSGKEQEPSC